MKLSEDGLILLSVEESDLLPDGSFVAPPGVTKIGEMAFQGCKSLEALRLPEGFTEIEQDAFWGCKKLKEINIAASVAKIRMRAFTGGTGCISLETLTLPECLKEIEEATFAGCKILKEINIPSGVTKIGMGAFRNCKSLKVLRLPEGLTKIGVGVFWGCEKLKEINIPASVTKIGAQAFFGCGDLSSIVIDDSSVDTFNRVKGLLPIDLQAQVVPKSVYDKVKRIHIQEETLMAFCQEVQISALCDNNAPLCNDVLRVISSFEGESLKPYQTLKDALAAIPLPRALTELDTYRREVHKTLCRHICLEKLNKYIGVLEKMAKEHAGIAGSFLKRPHLSGIWIYINVIMLLKN